MFIPLLLKDQYGLSSAEAGFALTASAISWPFGGMLQVRLIKFKSYRFCVFFGGIGVSLCLLLMMLQVIENWSYGLIYLLWGLAGFFLGQLKAATRANIMEETQKGFEGQTAKYQGMMNAIIGGFSAGIGGMIHNLGNENGFSLQTSIAVIWGLSLVAGILIFIIAYYRYSKKNQLINCVV